MSENRRNGLGVEAFLYGCLIGLLFGFPIGQLVQERQVRSRPSVHEPGGVVTNSLTNTMEIKSNDRR